MTQTHCTAMSRLCFVKLVLVSIISRTAASNRRCLTGYRYVFARLHEACAALMSSRALAQPYITELHQTKDFWRAVLPCVCEPSGRSTRSTQSAVYRHSITLHVFVMTPYFTGLLLHTTGSTVSSCPPSERSTRSGRSAACLRSTIGRWSKRCQGSCRGMCR